MKCSLAILAICWGLWNALPAHAQTLNEQLLAEDPVQLASEARRDGNIVRGAILFHQGSLNCVKCHRATAERDRIGPDLSRISPDLTDAYLVESILQPSKVIKEGYESVVALTIDGRVLSGMRVRENEREIVIRDREDVDKLEVILKEEVEEIRPGTESNMPDNLVAELENRQQFLDLLRYVFDVRERGPDPGGLLGTSAVRRELRSDLEGLVLIQERNCVACHPAQDWELPIGPKQPPRLHWSARRLNPEYIAKFIADPHGVKPGSTMPQLLGQMGDTERQQAAEAIAQYLVGESGNEFDVDPVQREAVASGYELFHSVGCVACHAPRNETGLEQPTAKSIPMGELAGKYDLDALVLFLEDPLTVRPSGHMPNMTLNHREAINIASFLLQSSVPEEVDWREDAGLAAAGKILFYQQNCANCHREFDSEAAAPANELALSRLNPMQGCLSGEAGDWPDFHLQPDEREQIRAAISRGPPQLTRPEQIEISLRGYNCIECHDRGDLGGVRQERNAHFQTTNLNLGDQGRIPPTLTGVGAKLKPDWMRDVLVNRRSIRPYMKTRMPQYGEANIGHLPPLFVAEDQLSPTEMAQPKDLKEARDRGLELAGNQGFNCAACHTYKYKLTDTMPAVDLTEMAERLNKDWFHQYMLEPQRFSPNTVMPSFWPGGRSIRPDIEGTPAEQIEALWQYLLDGRQARAPRGVVLEPLRITVADEARMLRRKYPGIGKRGIGVGYPGGVNIAFDAEQMRLGLVWKGEFVDPAGVWRGQGSGNVRPLGRTVEFPRGPDLDNREAPWVVDDGRPPHHQFQGYSLDAVRRPTFRYRCGAVEVKDFFSEPDDASEAEYDLRREIRLRAGNVGAELRLRLGVAALIDRESDESFRVGERLRIRVVEGSLANVVEVDDGQQLEIPLKLEPEEEQRLQIEYDWD